jgi:hypothetical protein
VAVRPCAASSITKATSRNCKTTPAIHDNLRALCYLGALFFFVAQSEQRQMRSVIGGAVQQNSAWCG